MRSRFLSLKNNAGEKGNVLFIILIAVVLFGALAFAITRTGRSSGNITQEKAVLLAQQLISYNNDIVEAVETVMANRCYDNQLNFLSAGFATANPSAPVDHHCDIYHDAGGGLAWKLPPAEAFKNGAVTTLMFDGSLSVPEAGSTCATAACSELSFIVGDVDPEVCKQINLITQNSRTLATQSAGLSCCTGGFAGTFTYDAARVLTLDAPFAGKKPPICFKPAGSSEYYFLGALLAR